VLRSPHKAREVLVDLVVDYQIPGPILAPQVLS
jgi:hypothetical protein